MILAIAVLMAVGPLRLESEWTSPKHLPVERVHAIAQIGPEKYVGGLRGLYKRQDARWTKLDERPVKQMAVDGFSLWILFGDGSVDKLELLHRRLHYDVLNGNVKRPWTSAMFADSRSVVLGGLGGWIERGEEPIEIYRKEMDGDVVTALFRSANRLWVGTQKKGLFTYANGGLKRYGYAAGLPDSWVTAMTFHQRELVVGVADGGLVRKVGEKFVPLASPCQKVRHLLVFNNRLVVGGMEGCWIQDGIGWQELSRQETTCLAEVGGKLAVGSPKGLAWWR